jgi:hypothetical protein
MFAFTSLALLALAAITRAEITVSTPSELVLCKAAEFQISGSTQGPYHAWVTKGSDPCGDAYHEDLAVDGNTFKWTPDLPKGTSVMIEITNDSGDVEGWSGAITISGDDNSCVTTSAAGGTTATRTTANSNRATSVPNNAASTPSDSTTSGAGRTVFGAASALTVVGAAMAVLAL